MRRDSLRGPVEQISQFVLVSSNKLSRPKESPMCVLTLFPQLQQPDSSSLAWFSCQYILKKSWHESIDNKLHMYKTMNTVSDFKRNVLYTNMKHAVFLRVTSPAQASFSVFLVFAAKAAQAAAMLTSPVNPDSFSLRKAEKPHTHTVKQQKWGLCSTPTHATRRRKWVECHFAGKIHAKTQRERSREGLWLAHNGPGTFCIK